MVRKRTVEWRPLTREEQEEVAMAAYKATYPDETQPDWAWAEVRAQLEDRDWDAAADHQAMAWMILRTDELFREGLAHPGHERSKLRIAVANATRLAGGGDIYRKDVLDAMEKARCLPANEDDVATVTHLAAQVELVAFLPPEDPLHEADTYTEVLARLSFDQMWTLAKGALQATAVFGSQEEWGADEKEAAAELLKHAMPSGLPPISPADAAAMNWWRRLQGGLDPVDEDFNEITWAPTEDDPDDFEPPMWRP